MANKVYRVTLTEVDGDTQTLREIIEFEADGTCIRTHETANMFQILHDIEVRDSDNSDWQSQIERPTDYLRAVRGRIHQIGGELESNVLRNSLLIVNRCIDELEGQ